MSAPAGLARELQRQQALLGALWRPGTEPAACPGLAGVGPSVSVARGLQAYRANAGAAAERALAASCPVVRQIVGEEAFAGLARACWRQRPPTRGDLAHLADALPGFVEADPRLVDVPYLADVARLEIALARAEAAGDAPVDPAAGLASLHLLAEHEASALFLQLAPGAALLHAGWPAAVIWQAHRAEPEVADAAMEQARAALHERRAETVFVWRADWVARAQAVGAGDAAFLQAVLAGRALDVAFETATSADASWAFEDWLQRAIGEAWVTGARHGPAPPAPD